MKPNRHIAAVGMFLVTALFTITLPSHAQDVTPDEPGQIAQDAYVHGYPLITMDMTRRVMANIREPEGTRAPRWHWIRMRTQRPKKNTDGSVDR